MANYRSLSYFLIKYSTLLYRYTSRVTSKLIHKVHDTESFAGLAVGLIFIVTLLGDLTFLFWGEEYVSKKVSHIFEEILHYSHALTAIYAMLFILNLIFRRLGDPLSWFKSIRSEEDWEKIINLALTADFTCVRKVTDEKELNRIVYLGDEAFGDTYITTKQRKSLFSVWHNANDGVFQLLTDPNDMTETIGYVCALPLKEEAAENYLHGKKLSLFGFNGHDILPSNNSTALTVYIEAVYLRPTHQNEQLYLIPLLRALLLCITEFTKSADHNKVKILAETFTTDGVKFVESLGFLKKKRSILDYSIYILDFSDQKPNRRASATMNVIRASWDRK